MMEEKRPKSWAAHTLGSGELLTDALMIVVMNKESKNPLMKTIGLGKRQGFAHERDLRTKRATRWRKVLNQRSMWLVSPLSLPTD